MINDYNNQQNYLDYEESALKNRVGQPSSTLSLNTDPNQAQLNALNNAQPKKPVFSKYEEEKRIFAKTQEYKNNANEAMRSTPSQTGGSVPNPTPNYKPSRSDALNDVGLFTGASGIMESIKDPSNIASIGTGALGTLFALPNLMKSFSSGKHKDQLQRDAGRDHFENIDLAKYRPRADGSKEFSVQLADNSFFDIGRDGGNKLMNKDGQERRLYEVDQGNDVAREINSSSNALGTIMFQNQNWKMAADMSAYLTNAAASNASTKEEGLKNLRSIIKDVNLDLPQASEKLTTAYNSGALHSQAESLLMGAGIAPSPEAINEKASELLAIQQRGLSDLFGQQKAKESSKQSTTIASPTITQPERTRTKVRIPNLNNKIPNVVPNASRRDEERVSPEEYAAAIAAAFMGNQR